MRSAALVCILAAAAIFAPSIIDRALRNRRTRQARTQRLAEVRNFWLDSEPMEAWDDDPTPMHDRLVCEQFESQFNGGAA